jgi:hypothetical protein
VWILVTILGAGSSGTRGDADLGSGPVQVHPGYDADLGSGPVQVHRGHDTGQAGDTA